MAETPTTAAASPAPVPVASGVVAAEVRGRLIISDNVVKRIATIAAAEIGPVSGATTGWTRMIGRGLPRATAKVAGGRARVSVAVGTYWPAPLAALTAHVRDHVNERVTTLTGLTVTAVDVTIADIVYPEYDNRKVQ